MGPNGPLLFGEVDRRVGFGGRVERGTTGGGDCGTAMMRGRHCPGVVRTYALSLLASCGLAHTARSFAHPRNSAISSERVIDSGTVDESAVSRSSLLSSCLRAKAA